MKPPARYGFDLAPLILLVVLPLVLLISFLRSCM
jgi:hypothetical protein